MKILIVLGMLVTGSFVSASASVLDVVRDHDGRVFEMDQLAADKYCKDLGLRLPTSREFALLAQSLGALGISETEKDGYYRVTGTSPSGEVDEFFYSEKGYQRPPGDLGLYCFWTALRPYDNGFCGFYGHDGSFDDHFLASSAKYAVRCASDK